MGVSLDEVTNTFCDSKYDVDSACKPESTLKKKNVSVAYHKSRESFVADTISIYFKFSKDYASHS